MAAAQAPLRAELEVTEWHTPDPAFFSVCSLGFETGDFVGAAAATARLAGPLHAGRERAVCRRV